jgi:ESCRT-I complex subunit TSG101
MNYGGQPTIGLLDQCVSRISFYQNTARLRQDVAALLYNCATLRPNVGSFQSGPGMITLFYLSGVIPITYSGANYNIPVTIYLDPPYPNQPPRVFVTPTADMAIKPNHKSVDMNGRVYLPELTRWNSYSSNLVSIVGVLSSIFSHEPPVHAVRRNGPFPPQVVKAHAVGAPANRKDTLIQFLTVKLRAKVPGRVKSEVDTLNRSRQVESEIATNGARMRLLMSDLSSLRARMEEEIIQLDTLDSQNRDWILRNETKSSDSTEANALTYLEADSAVGQQVIDLLAEECANEDLIDYLCALNREGKLGMSELLREMRMLTRKIFEIRTLKRKCLIVLQSVRPTSLQVPRP